MTNRILFSVLLIGSLPASAYSQKNDNIWLMGYEAPFAPDDSFCLSIFDFSNGNLQVGVNQDGEAFFQETNVSLCNAEGNLQMYSNGVHVFNKSHQIMENGAWLVPNAPSESLLVPQGVLAFYMPGNDQKIILIHPKIEYIEAPIWTPTITRLYYSIIDMAANNGLGKVIQKSIPFLSDTLDDGKLTAVKHGNGRDWWIIANEANSNSFYKILLDKNGVSINDKQKIGVLVPFSLGQAVFSPDGKTFATVGSVDNQQGKFLNVYDFDRCNGELTNPRQSNWHDAIPGPTVGVAIAPNSRYLYVSSNKYIYQYDLLATNLVASRQVVAIYDGFQSPFGSKFYLAQLGPDKKIYINCSNGETVMHVIHEPDNPGLACNVEQHGIQLPCYNAYTIPNFPNYRLGDWANSPCDSLGINPANEVKSEISEINIYPNPASISAQIQFHLPVSKNYSLTLYDFMGRLFLSERIDEETASHTFSLESCPSGWYFVCITKNGKVVAKEPLAVIRP